MADIAAPAPAPEVVQSSASVVDTPSPDTTVPVAAGAPEVVSGSGEPPRERWDTILQNTREKTRREVEAEYQQRYAPYQEFEKDPWQGIQKWLDQAEKHSFYGPVVKQYYQGKTQSHERAAEPQPNVPIVDEQGRPTGQYTYSADRLREWQRWNDQATEARINERLSPIEQREQQRAERERHEQLSRQADQHWSSVRADLLKQPYYKEHEPEIRQALLDHEEWGSDVYRAYTHVLTTKILPSLSSAEARSVIDTLQQQGAANTVTPGTTAVGTPKFKSFRSAAEYYQSHPEEAEKMARRR